VRIQQLQPSTSQGPWEEDAFHAADDWQLMTSSKAVHLEVPICKQIKKKNASTSYVLITSRDGRGTRTIQNFLDKEYIY
jgi:carbohydrate-binding DOMON domain-containing protein